MSYARNLYNLQQIELEIESLESRVAAVNARLKDRRALVEAAARLEAAQSRLAELEKRQHSLDWEIDDIGGKLAKESEALYSGRIRNPKELSSLKAEVDALKAKKDSLEDEDLELMEEAETAAAAVASRQEELRKLEAERQIDNQQLAAELEKLNSSLEELKAKREQALAAVSRETAAIYCELKKQKGRAVAVVEQGVCRGCGLSLSSAWLQRARGSEMVRCSSCGRILFLE